MNLSDITPAIFCKNEEYWIFYVLRDLLKVFDRVVMLDTGSQDATIEVAQEASLRYGGGLELIRKDFGDDPHAIGNSPNILREAVGTHWMMLLGGDEILREEQLLALKDIEFPSNIAVGMIQGWNVEDRDGVLKRWHSCFNADKFFIPEINWYATEYPFEGYGQHIYAAQGRIYYLPSEFYYWHVRCCKRSGLDAETYYREIKYGYYVYDGPYDDMPDNWLGEIVPEFHNPYYVSAV